MPDTRVLASFRAVPSLLIMWNVVVVPTLLVGAATAAPGDLARADKFRAGAHAVDISPIKFPVIVNAMFTERTAQGVVDPLFAKALVLDDGRTRIALCVVDSCMVPRDIIDRAKEQASRSTGIPTDRML